MDIYLQPPPPQSKPSSLKECSQVIWTRYEEEKKLISINQSGLYGISKAKLKQQQKQPGGVGGLGGLADQDLKAWCKEKEQRRNKLVHLGQQVSMESTIRANYV